MTIRTLEQHREAISKLLEPLVTRLRQGSERVSVTDPSILGRVLAQPVVSILPVPAFDNSQMDGYAVIAADLDGASQEYPVELAIGYTTAAGDPPVKHQPGTASPVMTGSAIPIGADAVIPIEEAIPAQFRSLIRAPKAFSTETDDQNYSSTPEGSVSFTSAVTAGKFVRKEAENIQSGSEILSAGVALTASRIGAIAAVGVTEIVVLPRPKVLLCTTGDEVVDSGAKLAPGQIPDANTPMLNALLTSFGALVTVLKTPDDSELLLNGVLDNLSEVDLVITSGGISKGAFEVVRDAFEPLGVEFHSVAIQPGGPQGFGVIGTPAHPKPLICFPGNPVSVMLSFELFLAPIFRQLANLTSERETLMLPLAHDITSPRGKHQIRRGIVRADGTVEIFAPGSHLIGDLANAEVLVHIPIYADFLAAGTQVETWRFND